MTATGSARIAIVYPSGRLNRSPDEVARRLQELGAQGLATQHMPMTNPSENGYTAGTSLERATQFCHALTSRKYPCLWTARGGYGATETFRALEHMLPPVLPPKTFVGFSDASAMGVYLALRFPNFTYIHGNHAFDKNLFDDRNDQWSLLRGLLRGESPAPRTLAATWSSLPDSALSATLQAIEGPCIPVNLSLAESLSSLRHIALPEGNILFVEDLNEDVFRLLRKFDSLINSGFLASTRAIVLGTFTDCLDAENKNATEAEFAVLVARKVSCPVLVVPHFGHDAQRLPLVCMAPARITRQDGAVSVTLSFARRESDRVATLFPADLALPSPERKRLHFTGIGGTGMAAVAGLFKSAGFEITGSDNPIYPPMDKVIKDLGIDPQVGYTSENISAARPDGIILANVITRMNAELKPNLELESLLASNLPMFSFPAALRKFFLARAFNIVVSGTHGKTTTTSLLAQALSHLGHAPSFFVGGAPKNFASGFALRNKDLFVLEGDEYDSAFFDKGPKFLHYEPNIALINNIEFDHADIYADVEAIEDEFLRLARLTKERGGIVVANLSDERVARIVSTSAAPAIGFGGPSAGSPAVPIWKVLDQRTHSSGSTITLLAPDGREAAFETAVFGKHNALNVAAACAVLQAHALLTRAGSAPAPLGTVHLNHDALRAQCSQIDGDALGRWEAALASFQGVKRRFELIGIPRDIAVFDDFAHHPTAIDTTLEAFRAYARAAGRTGRLVACFDPRNATMRRRVLQNQLAQSFSHADLVFLGKVPKDLRLQADETLDGPGVAQTCGAKARYFDDNELLCTHLCEVLAPGDTVVFMSSGAFDGLPRRLAARLESPC